MTTAPEIKETKLFINNEYVNSVNGQTFDVENPANAKITCQVQEATESDVNKAVAAARAAFAFDSPWRSMNASCRGRLLYKLADEIEKEIEYFASLETLDCGKNITDSTTDIRNSCKVLRYYAGWADKIQGKVIPMDGNYHVYTRREPVGVVAAIIPWNYPFYMAAFKLAPCLAAGCTMVLKPAEQSPLTAIYLGRLIQRLGFPPGVINILPGFGPTCGAFLAKHMDVNKVAFTGSTEVGQLIMGYAAASNLKRVTLELGGKSPLIICNDVEDLDQAAFDALDNAMANSGQCCVAATRTFVQSGIYDKFVSKLKAEAEKRVVGDPFNKETTQGPQVNKEQFDKILDLIESGKKDGANLVTGGDRHGSEGYFIQPTVFTDVKDDMRIAREEIFGPVQSVFKFDNIDEVIKRANNTKYGLGAGVYSNNVDIINRLASTLEAGNVWVNCYLKINPQAPFGGFKMSGFGREMSEYGLDQYCETKAVYTKVEKKNS